MLRMDSHPDEFETEFSPIPQDSNTVRWRWAIRLLVVQLFREKYWALQETAFSKRVMACLIDGSDDPL